jgi:saccharopine dehydrogenase-like NADP-dependent oxidoreductase
VKRILILGAGMVSRPIVHYLSGQTGFEVTVASRTVSKAEALVEGRPGANALALNVKDQAAVDRLVSEHDIAVSLLPATEHVTIAKMCLEHKKHMSTTSYISAEMQALDGRAKAAGLTLLNECGVDPGTDHMSAMRVIHGAERDGGNVVSFRSYCGGLPAPEANTNPIGYKFSWAPRGVLVAATNPARFLKDGRVVEVPGGELFAAPEVVDVAGGGKFEGYPNRDSVPYQEMYGLKDLKTMFRGTLRNLGHCEAWYPWVKLGLLDPAPRSDLAGKSYLEFMRGFVDGASDVRPALAQKLGVAVDAPTLAKLDWLGMFDDEALAVSEGGNVDVMSARMLERCRFSEGERDMIAMQHEFTIEYPDRTEEARSTLVDFGIPGGDTSMARTVSLPVAIATRMILEDRLTERGIVAPVRPETYNPILDELATMGIEFKERVL